MDSRVVLHTAESSHRGQRTHSTTTTHSSLSSLPTGAESMLSDSDESDSESTGRTSQSVDMQDTIQEEDDDTPAPSVFSFRSSRDGGSLLRESEGRLFNAQNELYALPADEPEFSRLDDQHTTQVLAIGGLYLPKELVESILAPQEGVERAILDLGSGAGSWTIAMAKAFPHAQVVGIDLAPATTKELPPNCRFEFDDFALGLPHYYDCFDVVHARFIVNGVTDYSSVIGEMARCLRPGGIVLLTEGDCLLLNENLEPFEPMMDDTDPSANKCWTSRFFLETCNTLKRRGSDVDAVACMGDCIRSCDILDNTEHIVVHTNIGPWRRGVTPEEQEKYNYIGEIGRKGLMEFGEAIRPLLLSEGYVPDTINTILFNMNRELQDDSLHTYVRWHYAWGTRRIEASSTEDDGSDDYYSSTESSPATGSTELPLAYDSGNDALVNNLSQMDLGNPEQQV